MSVLSLNDYYVLHVSNVPLKKYVNKSKPEFLYEVYDVRMNNAILHRVFTFKFISKRYTPIGRFKAVMTTLFGESYYEDEFKIKLKNWRR